MTRPVRKYTPLEKDRMTILAMAPKVRNMRIKVRVE